MEYVVASPNDFELAPPFAVNATARNHMHVHNNSLQTVPAASFNYNSNSKLRPAFMPHAAHARRAPLNANYFISVPIVVLLFFRALFVRIIKSKSSAQNRQKS